MSEPTTISLWDIALEQCDTCGSIGCERWRRADDVEVCDLCWWLEAQENPEPPPPRPVLCYQRPRMRRARHSYCFTCARVFWCANHAKCPRCGAGCTSLTDAQLQLMERKPITYPEEGEYVSFGTRQALQQKLEGARAARKVRTDNKGQAAQSEVSPQTSGQGAL